MGGQNKLIKAKSQTRLKNLELRRPNTEGRDTGIRLCKEAEELLNPWAEMLSRECDRLALPGILVRVLFTYLEMIDEELNVKAPAGYTGGNDGLDISVAENVIARLESFGFDIEEQ